MKPLRLLWHMAWRRFARGRRRSHWVDMIAWTCAEETHDDQVRQLLEEIHGASVEAGTGRGSPMKKKKKKPKPTNGRRVSAE